jgi:hypothetical protein
LFKDEEEREGVKRECKSLAMDDEGEDWSRIEEEEKSLGFQDAYKEKSDLEKDLEDRRGMRNRLILFLWSIPCMW